MYKRQASYSGKDETIYAKRTEAFLATELMEAIQEGRTCLFQQRISNRAAQGQDSYEVLLRIRDKNDRIISPEPYLEAAERYNFSPNVDRWVVSQAFEWLGHHPSTLDNIEYISINLSGLSICDDSFSEFISDCFRNSSVPPEKICFEITETCLLYTSPSPRD